MAFNVTNPVVSGEKARASHYTRVFDNAIALKEARASHDLGGSYHDALEDTALVDIVGAVFVELDGTNLGGLTVEVHVMALVAAGTGYIRLYNHTTAAYMAAEVSFTNTTATIVKSTGVTLTTGVNAYGLRARGFDAASLPRIWGAKLVLR